MKSSKAAALKYDSSQNKAPKILASGKGKVAEAIINKAKEYDIPLFANKALVESLIDLEIESEIPQELYQAVVEVFVWLTKADARRGG
ncbi:Flagellar biosynthesis protein FlhB [hydrothermal vent metagenome]|uniref:Flagellar biosynthesis protein FlhB n=1 Tax=hydrothermal vent metagenome TaxID=652676 RepID=A0A1W1C2S2_9ZZZZ